MTDTVAPGSRTVGPEPPHAKVKRNSFRHYHRSLQPPRPNILVHHPRIGKPLVLDATSARRPEPKDHEDLLHGVLERADDVLEFEDKSLHVAAAAAMAKGFRRTSFFKGILDLTPTLNRIGNLSGMVTSADLRAFFGVAKDLSERVGVIGTVVGLADETWQLRDKIADLAEARIPVDEKVLRSAGIVLAITARATANLTLQAAHFAPWVAKTAFHMDMSDAYEKLGHAETVMHQVTDPDRLGNAFVFVESKLLLK